MEKMPYKAYAVQDGYLGSTSCFIKCCGILKNIRIDSIRCDENVIIYPLLCASDLCCCYIDVANCNSFHFHFIGCDHCIVAYQANLNITKRTRL